MSVKYEVLASTGKYTDKNGQEKSRWTKCGIVMETKNGGLALKMESMPVGNEFNGWFTLAEPRPRDQQPAKSGGLADMADDPPF